MTIGCNIWMICLILIWFLYGRSRMFQLPQFVWALRSSVWGVFINFLLIDATDKSKISIDQKRFFIALSLYPLSFFANTPFKLEYFFLYISWKEVVWFELRDGQIVILIKNELQKSSCWNRSNHASTKVCVHRSSGIDRS